MFARAQQRHDRGVAASRRPVLLAALGSLLIAGLAVTPSPGDHRLDQLLDVGPEPSGFRARGGDCLNWPDDAAGRASIVDCADEHKFEVAESVDMGAVGEQCQVAVQRYLGNRYDPNSRFSTGVLWFGDGLLAALRNRRMLCGLQLPGASNQPVAFRGRVADLDQSKVWPAGTCLGIDTATGRLTGIPVDCAGPHAVEVTGAVNLAEQFPGGGPPAEADQERVLADVCTHITDDYLAPAPLRATSLSLNYATVPRPSWSAGSRKVACTIGSPINDGGWASLAGSGKGGLLINGHPPQPPIPDRSPISVLTGAAVPNPQVAPPITASAAPAVGDRRTQAPSTPPSATPSPAPPAAPVGSQTPTPPAVAPPDPDAPPGGTVLSIPGLAPITLPALPAPPPSPDAQP